MLCCDSGSERGVRCHRSCLEVVRLSPPPPLLLPPPPGDDIFSHKHLLASSMAIMACIIGGSFFLALFCLIMRTYYTKRMNSRRSSSISFGTQEDFLEEDQGPHMDHPIWYINTIGLQQFVIDSITVFKYRKDDGLIEGTECSVCLSEFQEEESLRLLPKCSHGFHLPCIDTWLRSHKNCPLCRAPVVSDAIVAQATPPELNSDNLSSPDAIREDNLENQIWEGNRDVEEGETSEERIENDSFGSQDEKTLPESRKTNCDSPSRVLSDLASTHRVVEDDIQPMRRSVSLDSSSASMIYNAVAGVIPGKHQQSFDSQAVKLKNPKAKRTSPSLCKLVKSSSIRYSLQKVPVSMKRSFSSGGKIFSSRRTRSQDSILPL